MMLATRILSFTINNYRSCQHLTIEPNANLSALIGINGSGKTNILNAILLLRRLFTRKPYRMAPIEASANSFKLEVAFGVGGKVVRYEASVFYSMKQGAFEDIIDTDEKWNFLDVTGKNDWFSFPAFILTGQLSSFDNDMFFFWGKLAQHKRSTVTPPSPPNEVLPFLADIGNLCSTIKYYSASQYTNPTESPAFFEIEGESIKRPIGRSAHTRFLYDLYNLKQIKPGLFEEYKSIVGKNGIGLVDDIKLHTVPVPSSEIDIRSGGRIVKKKIKRLLIVPHFVIHRTKLSPSQLSEGTFKTLAVVLYLRTDTSKLLLLEEPEVCIHHGLLASLIELIKKCSEEKQVIVTTHSEFVLDHVTPEEVFLVKNVERRGTTVNHLPEALSQKGYGALKEYLFHSGNLGEYWRHTGFQNG